MPRLLVIHHTPSPAVHAMFTAVMEGARHGDIVGVDVVARPALVTTAVDVLEADAMIVGGPANLGYMAGALKHCFDQIYYPCLDATVGRPYGVFLHGNNDVDGAQRAIEKITTGLQWRLASPAVSVIGEPSRTDLDACHELGAVLAAGLTLG